MKNLFYRFIGIIFGSVFFYGCSKTNVAPAVVSSAASGENITTVENPNKIFTDLIYAQNIDWQGQLQDLDLDIYLPLPRVTNKKFPLILYLERQRLMFSCS